MSDDNKKTVEETTEKKDAEGTTTHTTKTEKPAGGKTEQVHDPKD